MVWLRQRLSVHLISTYRNFAERHPTSCRTGVRGAMTSDASQAHEFAELYSTFVRRMSPKVCRFSDAGNGGSIHARWRPASEKRQGRKSRSVVRRRCGGRYGDFVAACWLRRLELGGRAARFTWKRGFARGVERVDCIVGDEIDGMTTVRSDGLTRAWALPGARQQE